MGLEMFILCSVFNLMWPVCKCGGRIIIVNRKGIYYLIISIWTVVISQHANCSQFSPISFITFQTKIRKVPSKKIWNIFLKHNFFKWSKENLKKNFISQSNNILYFISSIDLHLRYFWVWNKCAANFIVFEKS